MSAIRGLASAAALVAMSSMAMEPRPFVVRYSGPDKEPSPISGALRHITNKRKRSKADLKKKAARKRQRKARAITRRSTP